MASKKNILDSFGWFLEKLKSNFVKKSGDTMTGPLTISKTEIKNNDAEPADKITVSLPKESGTLMLEPESVTKNYVYAGPSGKNGNPTFRKLVDSDLPSTVSFNQVIVTGGVGELDIDGALNIFPRSTDSNEYIMIDIENNCLDFDFSDHSTFSTICKTSVATWTITQPNEVKESNISLTIPNTSGTLALKSDIPDISLKGTNNFSGENTFISTYMRLTTDNSVSTNTRDFIIDAKLQGQNMLIKDVYPAIWFRNKNLSEKNMCCLAWNTDKNYLAMYDQKTGKTRDLAFQESIDALNAKIGIFYLAESLLTPAASGDATLAALIKRLFSKGYLYGQASIGNYPELPVQSWTYVLKWQFTFDNNKVLVEIQQLYYTTKYTRWLDTSTGTWSTDSWS